MFSLTGKKALITGATGGIGGAIADALHSAGASIAISGSRQEKLAEAAAKWSGIIPLQCDLSNLAAVENLAKEAEEKLGGLDILICNAGVTQDNLTMRMKDEEWQKVIDVNLTASFKLVRTAMKGMIKRRSGRIIFITSVVGWTGNSGQVNYCASKAGLTGMCKSLAHEVASRNITVNCIAPGFIATNMTDILTDEQKAKISQNIPLGKMGSAEDIAAAALFLSGDSAAYITGHTLHVNGGMYMN